MYHLLLLWVTSPIAMGNQPHSYAQKQVIALGNQPHFSWVTSPIATSIAWLCFMLGKCPWLELALYLALCHDNEFILYSTVLIWTETSF